MKEKKEEALILLGFGKCTFLMTIIITLLYRIKKGLDISRLLSFYWLYDTVDCCIKYKKEKRNIHIVKAILSFMNSVLLLLIAIKTKNKNSQK